MRERRRSGHRGACGGCPAAGRTASPPDSPLPPAADREEACRGGAGDGERRREEECSAVEVERREESLKIEIWKARVKGRGLGNGEQDCNRGLQKKKIQERSFYWPQKNARIE